MIEWLWLHKLGPNGPSKNLFLLFRDYQNDNPAFILYKIWYNKIYIKFYTMNQKKLLIWEIFGIVFLILSGSFMHFLYSDIWQSVFASIIAPINESVWEHMKLAYIPLLLWSILEFNFLKIKSIGHFIYIKVLEMYLIIFSIISLFYLYTWILKRNLFILDILTYVFAVIIGQVFSYIQLSKKQYQKYQLMIGLLLAFLLIFAFSLFTFWQPNLGLFKVE